MLSSHWFEIMQLTVTQAAREYLERYVQKKKEREQQSKQNANKQSEIETAPGVEISEPIKKPVVESPVEEKSTEEQSSDEKTFGIVCDEDKDADEAAQKKLAILLEERYCVILVLR
jgi:hypothetical protein